MQRKNDVFVLESSSEPLSYQHVAYIAETPKKKKPSAT
jgi:hypothetical protein